MILRRNYLTFLSIFLLFTRCDCYKILAIFPTLYKSHWKIGTSIVKEIVKAGHDVTFVSPFELETPNVRNALLTNCPEMNYNAFNLADLSPLQNFKILPDLFEEQIDFTLGHPNVQMLLKDSYDAVIVEAFHSEALFGFGLHFNCPVVAVTTFGMSMYTNIMSASPFPVSYVPNLFLDYTDDMDFWQRLNNLVTWKLDEFILHWKHYPKQKKLYEKYFPSAKVPFDQQRKNVSILLNNDHFSSSTIRPGMPNIVEIGGIHIEALKALPNDLKDYLDSAPEGVILFSMGSIIKAVNWPTEKREAITKVFKGLKQRVLWKYENETLPDKPDNVMIRSWLPQRDILAHPNVKLFITHGGLLSTTEAISAGVPVLGIPVFGDQKRNMNIAQRCGYALKLEYEKITEESLRNLIVEALSNKKLQLKAKEISRIYNDRPMTPQKTLVYWVEYAIKHNGARHLRSAGLNLSYLKYNSIDVYMVISFTISALIIMSVMTVVVVYRNVSSKHTVSRFKLE